MSNNKQSSVDYYVEQLEILADNVFKIGLTIDEFRTKKYELLEQAKAMHKEESISYVKDFAKQMLENKRFVNAEIIYNETFGGNNE